MIWRDRREKLEGYIKSWGIVVISLVLLLILCTCSTKNLLVTDKTGSVFVDSSPEGADILVDQSLTGKKTPDTVFDIPVGAHLVWVRRSGYVSSPDSVEITVNQDQTDTVEFVLLETDKGSLRVSSNVDGATICIDNQPTAEITPHVFFNSVPVGTHIVSIFKEEYSNQSPAKEIVNIATGDTVDVDFILNPAVLGRETGNIIADFELEDDHGFWHRLYAYRGFVIVVNFWAESCVNCMNELPYLQEIYEEYLADSLIILALNYEDGFDFIRQIRQEKGLTFTLLRDVDSKVKKEYEISGTPVTIFLDREGKIHRWVIGFPNPSYADWFRALLDELFGN